MHVVAADLSGAGDGSKSGRTKPMSHFLLFRVINLLRKTMSTLFPLTIVQCSSPFSKESSCGTYIEVIRVNLHHTINSLPNCIDF